MLLSGSDYSRAGLSPQWENENLVNPAFKGGKRSRKHRKNSRKHRKASRKNRKASRKASRKHRKAGRR
jgi:hypothetical protein